MNDVIKECEEAIDEHARKYLHEMYSNTNDLFKSIEKTNDRFSNDVPLSANFIKSLLLLSTVIAVSNYHYQLREKLLEFGIDIGFMHSDNDT